MVEKISALTGDNDIIQKDFYIMQKEYFSMKSEIEYYKLNENEIIAKIENLKIVNSNLLKEKNSIQKK